MRETRYLWISNLPAKSCEDDVRGVLESHGRIQSVRVQENGDSRGAVVAFMDTKSATKALEFLNKLDGVQLSLEYCESTGVRSVSQLSVSSSANTEKNVASGNMCSGLELPRNDDRKTRSPDRNLRPRSRSTSVSSTPSEISSVTGSTMRRSGRNNTDHKSSSDSIRRRSDTNKYNRSSSGIGPQDDHSGDSDATYCWTGGGGGVGGGNGTRLRGLRVTQLPMRSTDTSIRDGLFHEYKKQGKITSVVVEGQGSNRYAVITFKRVEDAEKALDVSKEKIFFAAAISVERHAGYDEEDPDLCPPEIAMDEYHPKASKTLFVGNLPTDSVTEEDLLKNFEKYGEIIDIDIKQQTNQTGTSYAFIQFTDIKSVVRGLNSQDNIRINGKVVKLGFGKSQPTTCIWLDNLASNTTEHFLLKHFKRYGPVTEVVLDKMRALIFFETVDSAKEAWLETRKFALAGRKVHIDYANAECQDLFDSRATRPRSGNHSTFSPWNHENYRQEFQYHPYITWSYGKNMVPFVDERRRRFEEIRVHDDYEECDGLYRPDQFRDPRWAERQSYTPSTGGGGGGGVGVGGGGGGGVNVYDGYRQGSVSKRQQRYPGEMRSSSITGVSGGSNKGGKTSSSSKSDATYQGGGSSRVRSESPYSSSKSCSRSRERDKVSSSRGVRGEENEDEEDETAAPERGLLRRSRERDRGASNRKSGKRSTSRSHRSSSLADKNQDSSPRSMTRPLLLDSSNLTSVGDQGGPLGQSTSSSSTTTPAGLSHASLLASVAALTAASSAAGPSGSAGGEPSVECLSDLERERQLLLMELSKLEKDKDDASPAAATDPSVASSSSSQQAKRKVKHELRDVFEYDHLQDSPESKKLKSACIVVEGNTSTVDSLVKPMNSHISSSTPCSISSSTGCDIINPTSKHGVVSSSVPEPSSSFTPSSQPLHVRTTNSTTHSHGPHDVLTPTTSSSVSSSALCTPPVQSHSSLSKTPVDSTRPTIHIPSRNYSENSTSTPLSASHIPSNSSPTSISTLNNRRTFDFIGLKTSPLVESPPIVSRDPRLSQHLHITPVKLSPVSTGTESTPPLASTSVTSSSLVEPRRNSKTARDINQSLPGSLRDDDSETSDADNEKDSESLEERIRRLDDKINENTKVRTPPVNYSKFTIRKRVESMSSSSQPCSTPASISVISSTINSVATANAETKLEICRTDTSEFVKSMLSKQSIFDRRSVVLNSDYCVSSGGTSTLSGIAVQQPLTIGVSTGDSSTPSSLSSPGSVSLPVKNSLFSYINPGIPISQDSSVGLSGTVLTPTRTNCKLEACISSGVSPVCIDTKFVETNTPTRSILKKDSFGSGVNPFLNNNNHSPFFASDGNGISVFSRISRPLPSPVIGAPTRSIPTNGLGVSRNDRSLGSPSMHTPPAKGPDTNSPLPSNAPPPNTVSPNPAIITSTLAGTAISRPSRPGHPNPAPKSYPASAGGGDSGGHKSSNYDSNKKPLTNSGLNPGIGSGGNVGGGVGGGTTKRKLHEGDESKKAKVSKLENRPTLDDSFMNNPLFLSKDKKQHKKKLEGSEEGKLPAKKLTPDLSNFIKNKILTTSDDIKSESKKTKKHSDEKSEKHKKRKEKPAENSNSLSYSREENFERLFGKFDDNDRKKKLKKKHQKEFKAENKMDFKLFEERHKKEKKKHSHDREKSRNNDEHRLTQKSDSPSIPKKEKSSKFTDRDVTKKKKSSRKEKTIDSDSDAEGWRLALQAVAESSKNNWEEILPYESMYDKIKRRASKEAEKKQVPSSDGIRQKKSKHKKSSKIFTTDSEADHSDSIMSSLNEEASKSSIRKSKSGKSGRSKSGKRNASDDDLSDFPMSSKRNRLEGGVTDDSSIYSSSKLKKKSKRGSEDSGSKRKLDVGHKSKKSKTSKEDKVRKSKSESAKHIVPPKSRATVDSVFSDSSCDTSRASSPVRGLASLPDHSSDESKTTPSTEPMENSEGESNSNRRKSTEDDWKSSLPSSPLQEELDHGLRHSTDKKKQLNENITISEDLPCLEKQPEEELVGKSPLSIDDEPPDHLESIYDSPPCSIKEPSNDHVIDEHIVYDNMELSVQEDEVEQSLAIASILDRNELSKSFDVPTSKAAATASPTVKVEVVDKPNPEVSVKVTKEEPPEPPKLPIEAHVVAPVTKVITPPIAEISTPIPVQTQSIKVPVVENKEPLPVTPVTTTPIARCQLQTPWDSLVPQSSVMQPKPIVLPQIPYVPPRTVTTVQAPPVIPVVTASVPKTTAPSVHTETSSVTPSSKSRNTDSNNDAHDYTSYVQSVIERVKQEKDEETHHSRDKSFKRQKKYAPSASSGSSGGGGQNWQIPLQASAERRSSTATTNSSKKTPPATDLKPLVPPSVPPIPGVNVCTPVLPPAKTPPQAPVMALSSSTPLSRAPGTPVVTSNPVLMSSQILPQVAPIMAVTPVGMHHQPLHYTPQQLAASMPMHGNQTGVMTPLLAAQQQMSSAQSSLMLDTGDQSAISALSPQSSALGPDGNRRRSMMRHKRSESFSKSSDKSDQLLEETINDVVRQSREGSAAGDDSKRMDISANSSHSCNENPPIGREVDPSFDTTTEDGDSKNGQRQPLIDPYEPNFDESPPEQINLNRDLHRTRPPVSTSGPGLPDIVPPIQATSSESATVPPATPVSQPPPPQPVVIATSPSIQIPIPLPPATHTTTMDSGLVTVLPPTQIITQQQPPLQTLIPSKIVLVPVNHRDPNASLNQVIEDVVQGKFDVHDHLDLLSRQRQQSVADERASINSPHLPETITTTAANTVITTNQQIANFIRMNTMHQQPISPQSHLQMIPTSMTFGGQQPNIANAVQLGVVNSQPYTAVQAVEERGYPIERVPNPGLGPLTIGTTSIRPGSVGASTTGAVVSTAAGPIFVPVPTGRDTFSNMKTTNAMASPVLVSRPSSNPTGRPPTTYYTPTTPDQNISPTNTQPTNRPGLPTNVGQTAYRPPGFDSTAIRAQPPSAVGQNQIPRNLLFFYPQGLHQDQLISLAASHYNKPVSAGGTGGVPNAQDFTNLTAAAANLYGNLSAVRATTPDSVGGGGRPPSQQQQQQQQTQQQNQAAAVAAVGLLGLTSLGGAPAHLFPPNQVPPPGVDWITEKMTALDPRYRMVWKGRLALKNEEAHVQMHFVHGNNELIKECMSLAGHSMEQPLKIVQRMRLEAAQLEGVQRKMQQESDFCICLAFATGATTSDQTRMSTILSNSFIKYMQEKVAAGIINVCHPKFQQGLYVVHIFPPCEFSNTQLRLCAPDLLQQINQNDVPHLLVVITTV